MTIDLLGPDPIYQQIAAVVLERIEDGSYQPNRAIPSEAEMCAEFNVSRNTVRAAIRSLNERGAVRTVPGRGTFVVAAPPQQ
ncbi:GntR family transcriptional regulator [Nonomuraea sp. NPDC050404]|uniref:GntR family transcriptional regulator n=1 Tax=Nonomuraea sp. NPDC050404 TaxID=3155783 RepID=UPI0033C11234